MKVGGPDDAALLRRGRVLQHPLRERVLFEYAKSVTSPSKVAGSLAARVNVVSYHTGVLLRSGYIELVRTEARRGAKEHFYRALDYGQVEDEDWERLPVALRRAMVRRTLEDSWREAVEALPRGGMDDANAHVSRTYLELDAVGLDELAELLRSTLAAAEDIGRASRARAGGGEGRELVILEFERPSGP